MSDTQSHLVTSQYEYDFFSPSQIQIFIGDVWVDDITYLSFNVEHPRIPIYGYSSVYHDTTTRGHVLVTGNFVINFKEAAYLYLILKHYQDNKGALPFAGTGSPQEQLKKQQKTFAATKGDLENIRKALKQKLINYRTAETMYEKDFGSSKITPGFDSETGRMDTLRVINSNSNSLPQNQFEIDAESYENQIWGTQWDQTELRADRLGPFDIYICYGDQNNQNANHTLRRLFDVELVGTSQAIEVGGNVASEAYTFIARDFI